MKKKKEREPQWYMSSTNIPVLNYNEYYMKKIEWLMYTIAFAAIGAVIGYIFYGGIGLDIHGEPTRITYIINLSVMSVFGIISFKILMPMRKNQLKQIVKRRFVNNLSICWNHCRFQLQQDKMFQVLCKQ